MLLDRVYPKGSMITRLILKTARSYCSGISKEKSANFQLKHLKSGDNVSVIKTITKNDVLNFAKLTEDHNYIHIDLPKCIVHGAFLNGLVSGIIGTKLPGPGTIVIEQTLHFPKPCYVGDTIEIIVQIVSARKIVTCKYTCTTDTGRLVLEGKARLIAPKVMTL